MNRLSQALTEYENWQRTQRRSLEGGDVTEALRGFVDSCGFHSWIQPIYIEEKGIWRIPELDTYWTRAGIVHLEEREASAFEFGRLHFQIYSCLREAWKRDELVHLISPKRVITSLAAVTTE